MKLQYPVDTVPEPEGGYHVTCPVLPGCFSQGSTVDEALVNIRAANELAVEEMLAGGESLPDLDRVISTMVSVYPEATSAVAGETPGPQK